MAQLGMASPLAFDYADHQRVIAEMRGKRLFFVGGFPKSGTTWLQILLNAHPDVSCVGEGHFLTALAPRLSDAMKQYNAFINHKNHEVLQDIIGFPQIEEPQVRFLFVSAILLLMGATAKARAVHVVGEKTPDGFTNLPLLAELFPDAKFIHVLRDPRDCTVSAWFHNQRVNAAATRERFPTLGAFAPYAMTLWLDTIAKWERFAAAMPGRCAVIRYEDLTTQPAAELARLLTFLKVATASETILDCIKCGEFDRLSGGRKAGVEDRGSLFRQGLPGDWRNHFLPDHDLSCQTIANGTMVRYGYGA
jgi:hypothetical protein